MLRRLSLAIALGSGIAVLAAAPALAASNIYYAAGTGDAPDAACRPYPGAATAFRCDSLRAAVSAAGANPNAGGESDIVFLQAAGTYQLTQGPALQLTDAIGIWGRGPRTTAIQGGGGARVFEVGANVQALIGRVKIAGGRAGPGDGGNILNRGDLHLFGVWLRDGAATAGGALANVYPGTASLSGSLVEGNTATSQGGGLLNDGGTVGATLSLINTTVAFNTSTGTGTGGGGIAARNGSSNLTQLIGVTLAHNSAGANGAGGIAAVLGGTISTHGTIFASNAPSNCSSAVSEVVSGSNLDDGTSCVVQRNSQNPQLDPGLTDQGGDTDVLAIPFGSPAKSIAVPCIAGNDQRNAPRDPNRCDAGAFEQGAVAPPIDSSAPPDPVFQQPPPPPPTATPVPSPEAGKSVVATEVSGKVRVRRPGSNEFVDLDGSEGIPLGSTVDTKGGTVQLSAQQTKGAAPVRANFFDGIFKVTQTKTTTDLTLNESLTACKKSRGAAAAKKPKTRKLWGDGSGSFRTRGQYSSATVRGTKWLVQDSCAGTLTKVSKGTVSVRDDVKRKTIIVRAGTQYLARPRR
jgi:hypothetical protein